VKEIMATEETVLEVQHGQEQEGAWSGGKKPFKVSYGKLMMWYFLLSDAFTFAGFLIAYGALRFSMPTWPLPDVVFSTLPGGIHDAPLIFVTIMTFILIVSSVTMVRAVQEGHRENQKGVTFWMLMTIIGGLMFLGCQAWEWNTLINGENMSISRNVFGTHPEAGVYIDDEHGHPYEAGAEAEKFDAGDTYLLHAYGHDAGHGDGHGDAHGEDAHGEEAHSDSHGDEAHAAAPNTIVEHPNKEEGKQGMEFISRRYKTESGEAGEQSFGPYQFGALFFSITGFHGFHVFSGIAFLIVILLNVISGVYADRKNGYEMVEKIGLYWHFVDLVWVFVFLVFYLL
jgi:cytochrome c oxidase subunit 3